MITINNDTYRNLQEQVLENKEQIAKHWNVDRVLADFGIKVVGQLTYSTQLPGSNATYPSPAAPDYTGNYGDAYAVGTSEPYNFWIYTRADANAGYTTPYWLDIGRLAVIGPQGPAGQDGAKGDTGERGSLWFFGTSLPSGSTYKQYDKFMNTATGVLYNYSGSGWTQIGTLRGPQGIQGIQGKVGPTGPQGPRGAQGAQGNPGQSFHVEGIVETVEQLPTPTQAIRAGAYEVGNEIDGYDMYIIVGGHNEGDTLEWFNAGKIEGIEGPQGPQGPQGVQGEAGVSISEFTVAEVTSDTENTYTKINAEMTDGSDLQFTITAQRGPIGPTGAKITGFSTINDGGVDSNNVLKRDTVSTVTVLMSDGSSTDLSLSAANGISGTNWWFGSFTPNDTSYFESTDVAGRPDRVLQAGDFYLQNTGEVYRCESVLTLTTGHWVSTGMTLKGPQGENGDSAFNIIEYTIDSNNEAYVSLPDMQQCYLLKPTNADPAGQQYWSLELNLPNGSKRMHGVTGTIMLLGSYYNDSSVLILQPAIGSDKLHVGTQIYDLSEMMVKPFGDATFKGLLYGFDSSTNFDQVDTSKYFPGIYYGQQSGWSATLPDGVEKGSSFLIHLTSGYSGYVKQLLLTDGNEIYMRENDTSTSEAGDMTAWVKLTGGAGGSGLPAVTTDNNGQFLRVVDGVWAAATVPNAEEASF